MERTDAHEALIQEAKDLGVKTPHMLKPENLEKKIQEAKVRSQAPKEYVETDEKIELTTDISLNEFDKRYLDSIGFDLNWFASIANQYGIDRFEYIHKFRAFRAYKSGVHADWLSINDVGLLNNKRDMCEILLKHGNVSKERRVFNFHWRT